jgi:hypothetical protein
MPRFFVLFGLQFPWNPAVVLACIDVFGFRGCAIENL